MAWPDGRIEMQKKVSPPKAKLSAAAPIAKSVRSAHKPPPAIYALGVWSVKKVNGKWYISQAARFDDKAQWSKPYATLQRATTAIARHLADEVMRRHKRHCEYYGVAD